MMTGDSADLFWNAFFLTSLKNKKVKIQDISNYDSKKLPLDLCGTNLEVCSREHGL